LARGRGLRGGAKRGELRCLREGMDERAVACHGSFNEDEKELVYRTSVTWCASRAARVGGTVYNRSAGSASGMKSVVIRSSDEAVKSRREAREGEQPVR